MNNIYKILPFQFTDLAAKKAKFLIIEKNNINLKFRVYIRGGGCNGFQYGFSFDETIHQDDLIIEKKGVILLVDSISLQYIIGGSVDYKEDLTGSRFVVINPNVKTTCSCGLSFDI